MNDLRDFGLRGVIIVGINILFVAIAAWVCWLMGHVAFIGPLVLGFVGLWAAMIVITTLLAVIARYNRQFNMYDRAALYLGANIITSAVPLLAFVAYIVMQAHQAVLGAGWIERLALYGVGFLASYIAHAIVTVFFNGQLYAIINLFIALIGYLLLVLSRVYF